MIMLNKVKKYIDENNVPARPKSWLDTTLNNRIWCVCKIILYKKRLRTLYDIALKKLYNTIDPLDFNKLYLFHVSLI